MCGIAGWIDWQRDLTNEQETVKRMACTLQQRGPDAEGIWTSPHAALAHRRLIVIDPAGGKQPMVYAPAGKIYAVTYNGEIYNFRELKQELIQKGHTFHTQSDTEVLLHAYTEWGEACLQRFNGIFAFALWDEERQKLLLARDFLGVKPLFYAQRDSAIIFGSELKALLAHPLIKPEIDIKGLADVLVSFHTPGAGFFRDVHELRPGRYISFTREQSRVQQFWCLRSEPHRDDVPTTVEHVRSLLEDTVKRQLIADVPVVTLLSGGLDSSSVTALAAREFKREGKILHTYSIDFADNEKYFQGNTMRPSLDGPYIQCMTDYLGTRHHNVVVDTPALIENLLVPMYAHDRPRMGQIETSLYLLCKAIKREATVALSGESADEVFGGYPWFHDEQAVKGDTFPWSHMHEANGLLSVLSPEMQQRMQPQAYIRQQYQEALAEVPRLPGEKGLEARMREIFYLNLTRFLPVLLDRKDRMSMATGLEVRVPFCDHRLVEYVWNIPWSIKTLDGREKGVLRHAVWDLLPEPVRTRKKSAYPASYNPTYVQQVKRWTQDILNDANSPLRPLIDIPKVQQLIDTDIAQLPGDAASITFLFDFLIQTHVWLRDYHIRIIP
jgi:asparagine synthase (glutamine-hydrolysing)